MFVLCLQVEVSGWREQAEDILASALGVFEIGDSGQVGQTDLFVQTVFRRIFVDGEKVGAKNQVEAFPLLYEISAWPVVSLGMIGRILWFFSFFCIPLRSSELDRTQSFRSD